ncbi:erg26, C-3 sterol dehydrogenase, partial [Kickxella alabastrina]
MVNQREVYLVVGGEGFLGRAIVQALLTRRAQTADNSIIRVLDITRNFTDPSIEFIQGDITNASDVTSALTHNNQTATTVFHTASPLMKSPEHLHTKVNITGTRVLLDASKREGVAKFVYTSSASVVYSGGALEYVDESLPYAEVFADYYSETKAAAEKMVLAEDACLEGMRTAALRPSGIFGPGDRQVTQ